ncbi:MAG: hypothetical protein EA398_08405 [Deltaproteobacteria bacterium]|nr:MAG: hypothetical protein EA398_08405 [Deltaproteobacteria bacterium]
MTPEATRTIRRPIRGSRLAGLLLSALFVVVGCAEPDTASVDLPDLLCSTSADCPEGYSCQSGLCAQGFDTPLRIVLHLRPPQSASGLAPQLAELDVRLGTPVPDLVVTPPVRYFGTVVYDAVNPDERVAARNAEIRFVPVGPWAHLFDPVTAISEETAARAGYWDVALSPGTYDVTIRPAMPNTPPTRFSNVLITDSTERTFVIPPAERARPLRGRLVRRDDASGADVPAAGVRVQAFSLDRTHLSTSGVTDASGEFLVHAPLEASRYRLSVRPTQDSAAPVPNITFEPVHLTEQTRDDVFTFDMGRQGAPVELSVHVRAPDGSPVPGANLSARSGALPTLPDTSSEDSLPPQTADPRRVRPEALSYAASARTDDAGRAVLTLFPQRYTLSVIPQDPALAIQSVRDVEIAPAVRETSLDIELGERVEVQGVVLAPNGVDPVVDARVTFQPLRDEETFAELGVTPQLLGAYAQTGEDGRFVLRALPGTQRVEITPPAQRGLARAIFPVRVEVDGEPPEDHVFVLPESGVVSGRTLRPDGSPLVGAEVNAWILDGNTARTVATSITGAEGVYRLLLPALEPTDDASAPRDLP